MECLGHFDGIVPSPACILTRQHGVHLLKTSGNAISETQNFKISLDASVLLKYFLIALEERRRGWLELEEN